MTDPRDTADNWQYNKACIMCKERAVNENEDYCVRCWDKVLKSIGRAETRAQD